MPPSPVLAIDRLQFRWPNAPHSCLDIARFEVGAAERVFLHGPSGSGKSTLLGLLGGVLLPQSGRVQVLGQDLAALPARRRDRFRVDHTGFLFQQFNLIAHLSVLENVLLPCRFSARRRARATAAGRSAEAEARRLLQELDLEAALLAQPVNALSVGQQQRVAAARALIGLPEIIIADEPTSSLDADRQEDFLELLLRECDASGATLLFVSHDRRLASRFTRQLSLADINQPGAAA